MSIELSQQRRVVWNWSNFLQEDTRPRVIHTATGATLCELVGHTDYIRGGLELPENRLFRLVKPGIHNPVVQIAGGNISGEPDTGIGINRF